MTTLSTGRRRLATFFLGLFLSLLAMVSLHDLSHRAQDVQCATTVQCDSPSGGEQSTVTVHTASTSCALCQFVHTPFLALTTALTLVVLLLHLCHLLARGSGEELLFARISPQLRAPPALV